MKKLHGAVGVFTAAALFAVPMVAQAQQLPVDASASFGRGPSGVVTVAPRAEVSGTPGAAFPFAAPHEIRYIGGVPCRTVLTDNGSRVPVACAGQGSS